MNEQQIKHLIGEYVLTIISMQSQIDTLNKELEALKKTKEESDGS